MDRPFVYLNMAATADGKITSAAREYPRFTSPADRLRMDRLRAQADAILIGAGTLRADEPTLHVRDAEMQRYRVSLGKTEGLLKVLVTRSARIDPASRFFDEADGGERIVATIEDTPAEELERLAGRAEVWHLGREEVDVVELLQRLRRQHAVERLLIEGGGELNWAFVSRDLVDEVFVTIAPALIGGRDAPTLLEGPGLRMRERRRLRLIELEREGDEIFCRYAVVPGEG